MDATVSAQPANAGAPPRDGDAALPVSNDPNRKPAVPPPKRRWLGPALLVLSLAVLYAPGLALHIRNAFDPGRFNDDARQQIWPFLQYYNRDLFKNDITAEYYLDCLPVGYKSLYILATQVTDPRTFSKVLPYPLLACLVAAAVIAGRRLQGRWAAWVSAAFCLGAPVFLGRMTGGLPRSIAFPLLACAGAALVCGRPIVLAVIVLLGAAFYPTVAVTAGLALAVMVLLLPASQRGTAAGWSLRRRIVLVAATASLTALIALPTQRASQKWGKILRPADAGDYPELGPAGRYQNEEDRVPRLFSLRDLSAHAKWFLTGLGGPSESTAGLFTKPLKGGAILILAVLGLAGFVLLARQNVEARRLLILPTAVLAAHAVSIPLAPYLYLPARYLIYPLPVLAVLVVPAGLAALWSQLSRAGNARRAYAWMIPALCGFFLVAYTTIQPSLKNGLHFAPGPIEKAGWTHWTNDHDRTEAFISSLPPNVLIAGWPTDMDDLPYVTGRSVFLSREGHQVFHQRYADIMRQRMDAMIDAFLSQDDAPLLWLRDQHVTHLLINQRIYATDPQDQLHYFKPYDARIAQARSKLGSAKPAALESKAMVMTDGDWVLLDLARLPSGPRQGP